MRTFVVFTITSILIVLNFDWSGTPYKKKYEVVRQEEPIAVCGVTEETGRKQQPNVFKAKCATCHRLELDETGPALLYVEDRLPGGAQNGGRRYLELFVRNEDSLIKANNEYAIKISESRAIDYRHNFSEITSGDWKELVEYLQ